jgi:hypothetical protein
MVPGSVQLAKDGKVIRIYPIRHDPSLRARRVRQPQGTPTTQGTGLTMMSHTYRTRSFVRVPVLDKRLQRSIDGPNRRSIGAAAESTVAVVR